MIARGMCRLACVVFALFLVPASSSAQPDPSDPNLKLWLKADSGLLSVNVEGELEITAWNDSSDNGTILAPRDGEDEAPIVRTESFPAGDLATVRFDAVDLPVPGNQNRLYQANNLGAGDPLDIGDGTSLTVVVLHKPAVTETSALGVQTIVGKRGNNSSVYTLGIHGVADPNLGKLNYVTYPGAIVEYLSGSPIGGQQDWHITMLRVVEDGLTDTVEFLDSKESSGIVNLQSLGAPEPIASRGMTTPEPFGIAGHSQECCGHGERYAGNIAEVIIYSRALNFAEVDDLLAYLGTKYFLEAPVGACNLPAGAGGGTCEILTQAECNSQGGTYEGSGTPCPGGAQLAADCNQDGARDLSDVVCLLGHLFQGNPEELPCGTTAANLMLMDCNEDGGIDLSDAIYKLAFLFQGGPPPEQGEGCTVIVDCPQGPGC